MRKPKIDVVSSRVLMVSAYYNWPEDQGSYGAVSSKDWEAMMDWCDANHIDRFVQGSILKFYDDSHTTAFMLRFG